VREGACSTSCLGLVCGWPLCRLTALRRAAHLSPRAVVVDGALDADTAAEVGAEALRLARLDTESGGFNQAGLDGHDRSVRDDVTCFLGEAKGEGEGGAPALRHPAVRAAVETLRAVHREVSGAVRLRHGASRAELQLAVYDPVGGDGAERGSGARYERHRDGFPSSGMQDEEESEGGAMWRRVTAIVYCNSSGWSDADGGALRLYSPSVSGSSTDVLPVAGRLVVPSSRHNFHNQNTGLTEIYVLAIPIRIRMARSRYS
jgi:hypothetical protein